MTRKMRAVVRLALATAGLVTAAMFGAVAYASSLPEDTIVPTVNAPAVVVGCPTEDSCALDYEDGNWAIRKVVP